MRVLLDPTDETMASLRTSWKTIMASGFTYTSQLMQRTVRDCLWEVIENAALATHADAYEQDEYFDDVVSIVIRDWGETADMIESLQLEINHLIDMDTDLGARLLDRADHYDWDAELPDLFAEVVLSFMPVIDVVIPAATDIAETLNRIGIEPSRLEMLQFDRTGRYLVAELNDG